MIFNSSDFRTKKNFNIENLFEINKILYIDIGSSLFKIPVGITNEANSSSNTVRDETVIFYYHRVLKASSDFHIVAWFSTIVCTAEQLNFTILAISNYYADDTLNCEVFHYCQENQRHSWICPEGFTFHQIHLICMPPSNDNICQQSSKYHIVNEYLYKPLNLHEHQSKPNVTLRYSERYYPESYYDNDRYEDDEESPRPRIQHARQPLQVGFHHLQQQQQQHAPQQQHQPQYQRSQTVQQQQQLRHHQSVQQQISQPQQTTVFRKPLPVTTLQPQIQPQIRTQAPAPTVTPSPYRYFTAAPQLQQHYQPNHQQVYRTPEEINISLQQRRPQIFIASTTPRYYEDEYLYERK